MTENGVVRLPDQVQARINDYARQQGEIQLRIQTTLLTALESAGLSGDEYEYSHKDAGFVRKAREPVAAASPED